MHSAAISPPDRSRIPELDGVRAIAIWMVIFDHIFFGWSVPEGTFAHIPGAILQLINHGWLGVDLFFVLSGFLITGILLDSKAKQHYFRNFYARRFLRIMPLYFAVVLAFVIFYGHAWPYCLLSTIFAANLAHMFGIAVPHGAGALWSLAVEEHFYLMWPLLVYVLDRRRLAALAVAIIVATPIARGIATAHGMPVDAAVYCYSWFRFDGIALGALIAIWVRSPKATRTNSYRLAAACLGVSAVITIVGAFFGLGHAGVVGTALRFNQAQFPFAALVLMAFALSGSPWTRLLRNPFARLSGDLSYCLYLIHVAIGDGFESVTSHFRVDLNSTIGGLNTVLLRGAIIIALSFGLAMLSKKYLEDPFLRLKRHFSESKPGVAPEVAQMPIPIAVPLTVNAQVTIEPNP